MTKDDLLNQPLTSDDLMDANTYAAVHGSSTYTTAVFPFARTMGKSRLMAALYGSSTGSIGTIDRFRIVESKPEVFHVFHHTRGYMAVSLRAMIPNHCYYLIRNEWYQRGRYKHKRIPVSRVPAAHRLFLMMNHIDQPE